MYDQAALSELIQFARVHAGSTVIDVYPGRRRLDPPLRHRGTRRTGVQRMQTCACPKGV